MALLLLVRHAAPTIDLALPHSEWPLSKRGVTAAKALGLSQQQLGDSVRVDRPIFQ